MALTPVAQARSPSAEPDLRRDPLSPRASWAVFGALLVAALAYLMWKGRGNTVFYDDWPWITLRRSGLHPILSAYNEHLVAAPVALYQLLLHTVGLRHYGVYRLVEAIAHLGCATVVFVFARRRIGSAALPLTLPIVLLGSGSDYLLLAVNFGFVASIGLSIGALLLLEREDRRSDQLACGLLVLGMVCSEFTTVFALGIGAELLWRERSPRRVYVWLVPLALYAAWWLAYHQPSMARHNLTAAPAFAADLAANAIGGWFGLSIDWGRPLLVAGVALLAWRLSRRPAISPRILGLLVTAGAFWVVVGLGRAHFGQATATRYVYTGAILVVLIVAEAARGLRPDPRWLALGTLVALFALAGNLRALTDAENGLRVASSTIRTELAALPLVRPIAAATFGVDPRYAPGLGAGQYFAAIDAIGSSPADTLAQIAGERADARAAADNLLLRAGELQVSVPAVAPGPGPGPPLAESAEMGSISRRRGCVSFRPQGSGAMLDLRLPPSGLELRASAGPLVPIRARRLAGDFSGAPIGWIPPGATTTIRATADPLSDPWHVRVSPDQPVTACSLG